MYCKEEYKALLAKISLEKEKYSQKDTFVTTELETKIQYTQENIMKWQKRTIIYFIFACLSLWPIFYFFTYFNIKKYIFLVILILTLGLFVFITMEKIYTHKINKYNEQKQQTQDEKELAIKQIKQLNNQIQSLIVSVITINEHYNELSNITNEEQLKEKWNYYTKQLIMAINYKYNYKATYTDYQEYFQDYEKQMENKQSNEK